MKRSRSTLVAFQGEPGAFSELAATSYFSTRPQLLPCREFADVFAAVETGKARAGVIPIENSLTGSIHQNFDLLVSSKVWITGEVKVAVAHDLLAKKGTKISDIREVISHPQALSQCASFFKKHRKMQPVPFFDTAGSAKHVAHAGRKDLAAIAGRQAGRTYGLVSLKSKIQDNARNFTRFFVVERPEKKPTSKTQRDTLGLKTSIVFALKNIPGALYKSLSIFAIRDIDLLKIESRPIPGSPWEYLFYLDFAGAVGDERSQNAVKHLGEITKMLKVLGTYKAAP